MIAVFDTNIVIDALNVSPIRMPNTNAMHAC